MYLGSYTGTIGQYMHKSTSSKNTDAMGSVGGAKTGCLRLPKVKSRL